MRNDARLTSLSLSTSKRPINVLLVTSTWYLSLVTVKFKYKSPLN